MKTLLQKKSVSVFILTLVLMIISSSALAALKSGQAIDVLIPKCEDVMEWIKQNFPNSYTVSKESMLGKAGTVFIDMDKGEVKMIGETSYRKYTFEKPDEIPFVCCTGIVLYAIDNTSALDYGVNVYLVENKNTTLLDEKEISTLAAQFITALGV